MPDLRNN